MIFFARVAQLVEHGTHKPGVASSNLAPGTMWKERAREEYIGGVAQLVRASACHAEGRRFEPGRPRQYRKAASWEVVFFVFPKA